MQLVSSESCLTQEYNRCGPVYIAWRHAQMNRFKSWTCLPKVIQFGPNRNSRGVACWLVQKIPCSQISVKRMFASLFQLPPKASTTYAHASSTERLIRADTHRGLRRNQHPRQHLVEVTICTCRVDWELGELAFPTMARSVSETLCTEWKQYPAIHGGARRGSTTPIQG